MRNLTNVGKIATSDEMINLGHLGRSGTSMTSNIGGATAPNPKILLENPILVYLRYPKDLNL